MEPIWIFGIFISWIVLIDGIPVEYVYTGDGCECPGRLGYQINVPKLPKPKKEIPYEYGYKIDVPPIQAKAKVSYTFDFSVEEPRPPRPEIEPKLDLYAKVDRISLHKEDCPLAYAAPPLPLPAPCGCGASKPLYRYVNGKWISSKCKCQNCKCHLKRRKTPLNAVAVGAIGTPIVVASGPLTRSKNSIRRKRDLRSFFFRHRRQNLKRPARYVKLYHKNLPKETQQGWFDLDLFSESNPFKRKSKKVFFPHTGGKIVKRDIKGEYDLLEKERDAADLTLPEIIQFMPETLQPDFKRGPCQFGCINCQQMHKTVAQPTNLKEFEKIAEPENAEVTITTEQSLDMGDGQVYTSIDDYTENEENNVIDSDAMTSPPFTKRNAAIFGNQQTAAPPSTYVPPQSAYAAEISSSQPVLGPTNPNFNSAAIPQSPCEQRKIYAAMRRAADASKHSYDQGQLHFPTSSSIADQFATGGVPLQYAGDLEFPKVGYALQESETNPMVGASHYPVQHIPSAVLDRIITDIVYRHPDFIDASTHYNGALVDPEPYQEQQTKDFIKKLIDGRLGFLFGEPENQYLHYDPSEQSYSGHSPYKQPRTLNYYPAIY